MAWTDAARLTTSAALCVPAVPPSSKFAATSERTHKAKTVTLWILVTAAGLASLAGILTIGVFTLPLAVAGAILLLVRSDRARGIAVILCAFAVGPLLLAWFEPTWARPSLLALPRCCRVRHPTQPMALARRCSRVLAITIGLFLHASRRDAIAKTDAR
jgi:hypothetical protein